VAENIFCEPVVSGGRVYAVARGGELVCLSTGDARADGWPMWGGSATRNGPARR
jgi:hypothetical protein